MDLILKVAEGLVRVTLAAVWNMDYRTELEVVWQVTQNACVSREARTVGRDLGAFRSGRSSVGDSSVN